MKKLQESLLDDEDVLLNDTRKATEIIKALKLITKINNLNNLQNNSSDKFGRKLNKGDIVIMGSGQCVSISMVHSILENTNNCIGKCILVFDKESFYQTDIERMKFSGYTTASCKDLIKIDSKILEQIMKVK